MIDTEAELNRIRQASATARQRIRRLDGLMDEQIRILCLDPALNGSLLRKRNRGHLITAVEIRVFGVVFSIASLGAFLTGFWIARLHF